MVWVPEMRSWWSEQGFRMRACRFVSRILYHLTVLVHGSVHVAPDAGDADVSLIDEPAVADTVTARASSVDDERGEALHPPVDGDVIDVDAALSQEFLDVSVGQAVAEIPADGEQDHLAREPEPSERRGHRTAAANHPGTL